MPHIRQMGVSITYTSKRSEVMAYYWLTWRKRLWKTHVAIFAATVAITSFVIFGGWPSSVPQVATAFSVGLVPLLLLAFYPMLMFKPHARVLTVTDEGITTIIGKRTQVLAWGDIGDVESSSDAIIVQRPNLNAFIVPARAFATSEARHSFENFIRERVKANVR